MAEEIKIGDNWYSVEPMDGMRALILQPVIAPLVLELGGAFVKAVQSVAKAQIAAGATGKGEESGILSGDFNLAALLDVDVDDVMPSLSRAVSKLTPADLEHATRQLLTGAKMKTGEMEQWVSLLGPDGGKGGVFSLKMRGHTLGVWQLLVFALKVNYPDFFGLFGGLAARRQGKASPPQA